MAKPELKDFQFTHDGVEYCVGYQASDEAFALSAKVSEEWGWVFVEGGIDSKSLKDRWGGYEAFLVQFVERINKKVFGADQPAPETEIEKLIVATGKLKYTSDGLVSLAIE
jgi:hypothetical protein